MGRLFVVGTPLGNLEDVTLRALRVLAEVDLIAAEDTRITRRLLSRHGIDTPVVSYHAHSPPAREAELVERLATQDVALVTDGGSPCISDPGADLVAAASRMGHTVVPIPGPSAVIAALSVAGLPADDFQFVGFLPRRAADRRTELSRLASSGTTLVAFEAPHRLAAALADLASHLPDRSLVIARELTKIHEEVWRGTTTSAPAAWSDRDVRGEITLVIGAGAPAAPTAWSDSDVRRELALLQAQGLAPKAASRLVASKAGRPARDIYRLWPHA